METQNKLDQEEAARFAAAVSSVAALESTQLAALKDCTERAAASVAALAETLVRAADSWSLQDRALTMSSEGLTAAAAAAKTSVGTGTVQRKNLKQLAYEQALEVRFLPARVYG